MALRALINDAECGPVNPLQSLSKQFDKDRGIQQDHFWPGPAGSSREVFRTQPSAHSPLVQEAAQFFSGQSGVSEFSPLHASSFNLSSLRDTLPQSSKQYVSVTTHPSSWAADFLNHDVVSPGLHSQTEEISGSFGSSDSHAVQSRQQYLPHMNRGFASGGFRPPMPVAPFHTPLSPELTQPRSEYVILEEHFPHEEHASPQEQTQPCAGAIDADELSRTAGLLVDTVKEETNPKFKNSAFLGLMRQLRDREMVVEGTTMVTADGTTGRAQDFFSSRDVKGKGKAKGENGWADAFQEANGTPVTTSWVPHQLTYDQDQLLDANKGLPYRKTVHFGQPVVSEITTSDEIKASEETESLEDRYWRQENEDYKAYWNNIPERQTRRSDPEWDTLQQDWDHFEATATGITPVSFYQFQARNPYLTGASSTRVHSLHSDGWHSNENILEMEAAVQQEMRNPTLWYQLGVKQQENERELHAIQALQRAVELDPSYLEAWLALAISYTNEGDRNGAYKAIEHWVRSNTRYESRMPMMDQGIQAADSEKREALVRCLMGLARVAPNGEVDADIQTALGVLLNTDEDYQKAQDCFRAALSVRPDDWLLYNRVGATLANSGRAMDAVWYYHQALVLNPSYIRARFNLGISCINMKQYDEAAQHILDALVLQEHDASDSGDTRGITSSALWDCLRTTSMHLQRPELAALCETHDLEGFRKAFSSE
ncbi:hypothetical protein BU17DRAFT_89018 [Hysterangium stoloniferum]|nr:hypothetical protein BU17DRAFT_89018 [Hysterangium stoloniferum]